jgi:hypothetical protein
LLLDGYIDIFMRAGLMTQEGINCPATINPNGHADVLAHLIEARDIGCFHA